MLLAGKPAVHTVHPEASISLRSLSTLLNSPFSLSLSPRRNCINGSPLFFLFQRHAASRCSLCAPSQHFILLSILASSLASLLGFQLHWSTTTICIFQNAKNNISYQVSVPSSSLFSSFVFIVYASLLHAVIPRAFFPLGKAHGRRARLFVHCLFLHRNSFPFWILQKSNRLILPFLFLIVHLSLPYFLTFFREPFLLIVYVV